jgi:plastocyanin
MRRLSLFLLGLVAALAIAACGGTAATSSPASQAPASQPPASAPAADDAAVTIASSTFSPGDVSVAAGGTVTWTNQDSLPHSVVFDDAALTDSDNLSQGDTFEATFATAGSFSYVCGIHPNMTGTVTVQ